MEKNIRPEMPDYFVIGNAKSGTTWLMECLNLHPETYCFNEIQMHDKVQKDISQLLQHLNVCYMQQHQTTFHEFNYFDLQFGHEDVDTLVATLWKIAINKVPKDAKFYGEKCPTYGKHLPTLMKQYPNAKFLHIVRDPRDVAISYWYHHLREWNIYKESKFYRGSSQYLPQQLVETEHRVEREQASVVMDMITWWKRDQTTIESMKKRFPKRIHTIRYEDMKDQEKVLGVFKFLGCEKLAENLISNVIKMTDVESKPKSTNTFFKFGKSRNWDELDPDIIEYMHKQTKEWLPVYGYDSE